MKRLWKNNNFVYISFGTFMSSIGDNLYNIALTISLYMINESIAAVAAMWFARAFMRIPVQFVSGIIADKINRKKIIQFTNFISVPIALGFIYVNEINIYISYFLIFLLQTTNDIETVAGISIIPEIVEKDDLAEANSFFSVSRTVALLISPGVAGIIYNIYGTSVLFVINALSFLIAGISLSFIKYKWEKVDEIHEFNLFSFAKEGYYQVSKKRVILLLMIVAVSFSILGRFFDIYKIYIADNILNIGVDGIIYFSYAMAIGGILAPFILKYFKKKIKSPIKSFLAFSFIINIMYISWAYSTNIYLSLLSLLILGIFSTSFMVFVNSIIQSEIEKEYLGRVFSLYKVTVIFSAIIGISIAPYLFDLLGVNVAISTIAGFGLLTTLAVFFLETKK